MGNAIELRGISKSFGSVAANKNINLTVEKGEILALLGENGSGKTTLMNMLSGIYMPDSGSIFVDGKKVSINSPEQSAKLGIGMVHQHFKLVERFTALENIRLGLKTGGKFLLGKDTRIEAHEEYNGVCFHPHIKIGNHVIINPLCHIGCIDSVTIGDYVVLSERCLVIDHTHGDVSYEHLSLYERERPLVSKGKVVIEDYVWMGENSVVMSGVTVGHNSLIGANAVVTKDIPPYSIVAGNPARILRTLEPPTQD